MAVEHDTTATGATTVITARGLTKRRRRGGTVVDNLSFDVRPGVVTGLLGPAGAGKSTTLRMIVGLTEPDAGSVTIAGSRYRDLPAPLREVGTLLDARAAHPGRTGRAHLRWLAQAGGVAGRRVDDVLHVVGLTVAADRRAGGYSLGMYQRLGIAAALLGDPAVLLLDEPTEGLDAEGVAWLRRLLRRLADEGRTVLVAGRFLAEMQQLADQVLVLDAGRLLADVSAARLRGRRDTVPVRTRATAPWTPTIGATSYPAAVGTARVTPELALAR